MQIKKVSILNKMFSFMLLNALLLFIISNNLIFAQQNNSLSWHSEQSPIFSNIKDVLLFSGKEGFAAGDQLLQLTKKGWMIMKPQPPLKASKIFSTGKNSVWIAASTIYQDSKLFFYDGSVWKNINNPLANRVNDVFFLNKNYGVVCGLGELAVFTKGHWKFLNPPTPKNMMRAGIYNDLTIWVQTLTDGIYINKHKIWKFIKNSEKARIAKLINNKLYFIKDSLFCKVENDSVIVLSSNKLLSNVLSFDVVNSGEVFAVGMHGLILRYENLKWAKEYSPVDYKLNSIDMISGKLGWIAGSEGTLLKYSSKKNTNTEIQWKGFQKIQFYRDAKVIDDEYGVAIVDFNNDGLPDIFTCGLFEENHLYMNQGENSFTDQAEQRGLIVNKKQGALNLGACAGDLDNDGDEELYVSLLNGANKIYWNLGDGNFVDYSLICNASGENDDRTNSVIFGDVDNDGDIDIFIANENTTNRLFINNGAGIFDEVTKKAGLETPFGGTGCSFADIDNDGDLDLYVANWSSKNILYKNLLKEDNKLYFQNITDEAHVGGFSYTKSNAVVFADIDNDADPDLFVTNRKTSNRLYINNGAGIFSDKTEQYLGLDSMKSYGAVIIDFDGDGYKDIYLANVGENVFYKNYNGSEFKNETVKYGAGLNGYSTGVASGDFDNDGDPDIYAANFIGSSSSIFINNRNYNNFVKIQVNGIKNNKDGIGTKIHVYPSGHIGENDLLIDYSVITAGESYASMNEKVITLGTQNYKSVDIVLIFPSGDKKFIWNIKPGSTLTVEDLAGFKKSFVSVKKWLLKLFLDRHILFELVKWIFVLFLLIYAGLRGKKKFGWSFMFITGVSVFIAAVYYLQFRLFEYKTILFSTILPLLSVLLLIVLIQLFCERRSLKLTSETEKQQIREKLSRDLHDDLASTIGSIAIYVELLKKSLQYKDKSALILFNKTQKLINDATYAITDLIWTIKPSSESLSQLLVRINENFANLFSKKRITFKTELTIENRDIKLEPAVKHNIYLILKEALNNILKYASADNVLLVVIQTGKNISFSVEDDGKGFNADDISGRGNGLKNMRKRSEEISAEFNIVSNLGEGTKINVYLKIA